jgi:NAD-dependent DNA ligase (contains BRCT domain type II)
LGKKVVEKFWEKRFIRFPQDIFKLDFKEIENLDGWGPQSVANLKYSINKSRDVTLSKFIFALGIRHIGQENAKLIAKHLQNKQKFININKNFDFSSFINIDGIGEIQISSIKKFFSINDNLNVVGELSKYMNIEDEKVSNFGKFKNLSFMITGKLENTSRAEAKSLIEKNAGKILSSVNKKLDFLIVGQKPTVKKVNQAKELNIKIINQKELLKLLN